MTSSVSDASTLIERNAEEALFVFDRRYEKHDVEKVFKFTDVKNYEQFIAEIKEEFNISDVEPFTITTTNRELITGESWAHIEAGDTLYILDSAEQDLSAQTQERVSFLPHYDTIVKGGMYEYYASEGQNPLPYAFAELIDNSLAATAENAGSRNIEIRLHLNETNPAKNAIYVIDNGRGMTSRQLNNWAVYRLSKFVRNNRKGKLPEADESLEDPPASADMPRSLNSDISYFGVGGKQAIFFIGSTCRMMSKPRGARDVHELTISKEEFEEKERNKEAIYSGFIRNRKPGDVTHLADDEDTLRAIIGEEATREHFTVAVINNINPIHLPYLRNNMAQWTRQLSHIYHYYIHGPSGNVPSDKDRVATLAGSYLKINIEVKLYPGQGKVPKSLNLRDVTDDTQTLFIRSAASTFEFKAIVEGTGVVEGILRYHPFLYDKESYPKDPQTKTEAEQEEDPDFTLSETRPARGKRPIFECYWNGRLIPYTTIEELDWCTAPKKMKNLPVECFNRVSGVLWTNDKFQVSTNKLTFIDLEMRLKEKQTAYSRVIGKNEKRSDISKEFAGWLQECHDYCDKQVEFCQPLGTIIRTELPRNKQSPWSTFEKITWASKVYKKGQMVRIIRTLPFFYGSIRRFILYGDHSSDVFATGGEVELTQEPRTLYDAVRTVPLSKLDRNIDEAALTLLIHEEEAKLPDRLSVTWPEGNEVQNRDSIQAGHVIGDMRVEIQNRKGESISKLPGNATQKLLMELKVIWRGPNKQSETMIQHVCQHGKTWPYWFKKMTGVLKNLGDYDLKLQAVLNESGAHMYCGRALPSHSIKFKIVEGDAEKFSLGFLDGPFKIGVPFNLPLEFQDEFGHPTAPPGECSPCITASGLTMKHDKPMVKGQQLIMKNVCAEGSVKSVQGENFQLSVKIAGMKKETQTMKIRMLPGLPHQLVVTPEKEVYLENGKDIRYDVEVRDVSGNYCSMPKLIVNCKFLEVSHLPIYHADCSNNGRGCLKGGPIQLDRLKDDQKITARLDLQGNYNVPSIERSIALLPSQRTAELKVFYMQDGKTLELEDGIGLVQPAGTSVFDLTFRVYDEAGREKIVDDSLASKIKVNWVKATRELVKQNKLPPLKTPTSIQDNKYCHVTLNDGAGYDIAFTIKAKPGPAHSLKAACLGSCKVRNGEKLQSDLVVTVKDAYGNDVTEVSDLKDLSITCEGLNKDRLTKTLNENHQVIISNIEFEASNVIGSRELHMKWENLEDFVRVEIVAGPPTKLTLPKWDTSQVVTVYNEGLLPQRLVCQVCDAHDNPCYQDNVRVQIAKDRTLTLSPNPEPTRVDKKGRVDFGVFKVSAKTGRYDIQPKGFVGKTIVLPGPKIKISIQADSTRAAKVELETTLPSHSLKAGDTLPDLTCRVYAEDDTLLQGAKDSWMHVKLFKTNGKTHTLLPDQRGKRDNTSVFTFTGRRLPTEAGEYNYQAVYGDPKVPISYLTSDKVCVTVVADAPVKLEPDRDPGTPTVSNTKSQACRVLLRNLVLQLKDKHGNSCDGLSGSVVVEIVASSGAVNELPCFVGGTKKLAVTLSDGECTLNNLIVQENCPGRDGSTYLLRCTPEIVELPRNQQIPPCDISFFFYNDVKKQQQMAALTKEHDNVKTAIATYKSLFVTAQQLLDELTLSLKEAKEEEAQAKQELRKHNVSVQHLGALLGIDTLIQSMVKEKDDLLKRPRRMCGLHPAPEDPHIIGKIAHLAQVEDTDIARVLSWHMSADMDCVVTLTTKKANEVYRMTAGKQQVLPLDSIFKKTLPEWNKPLPHERIRQGWKPTGKPVYARNCLVFPKHEAHCRIVFGMLLGDTVILDSLTDANSYRQEIVKHTHCPTILTREGDRIRSNGKFGGLMNRALPIEKLRGAVFAEPIGSKYHTLSNNINLLQTYKQSVEKRQQAETDLQEQRNHQNTPEMRAKYKECADAEAQLAEIESRLGLGSAGPLGGLSAQRKRSLNQSNDSLLASPSPKRAKAPPTLSPRANSSQASSASASPLVASASSSPAPSQSGASNGIAPTRQSSRKRKPTRRG